MLVVTKNLGKDRQVKYFLTQRFLTDKVSPVNVSSENVSSSKWLRAENVSSIKYFLLQNLSSTKGLLSCQACNRGGALGLGPPSLTKGGTCPPIPTLFKQTQIQR